MWISSPCCGSAVILFCFINIAQIKAQCTTPSADKSMVLTEANEFYSDGANATFSCSSGYLPVDPTVPNWISCIEGNWTELQLQCKSQCPKPYAKNMVLTETSDREKYIDGQTATFKCSYGYMPENPGASRSISCIEGHWTELELKCKMKSCGNPGEILNGWYNMSNGIKFGAIITGICNPGYQPVGRINTRKCLDKGWDGRATICEAVRCSKPHDIKDVSFDPVQNSYEYGDTITYSCNNKALTLIGERRLTCSDNGQFHPDPPQCRLISCPAVRLTNGYRIEGGNRPSYAHRNFLKFECAEGYKMNGTARILCDVDGWNPPPPTCEEVTCEAQDITFATIVGGKAPKYKYDDSIEYKCDKGYKLVGSSVLKCTENEWNQDLPVCKEVICVAKDVAHAIIVGGKASVYRDDDSIEYRCDKGYKMDSSSVLKCTDNDWYPRPPVCTEVTCMAPNVHNAIIVGGKASVYKNGASIEYICDKGYKMIGSNALTCTENGWNQPPPVCNEVTCVAPNVPNASVVGGKGPVYKNGTSVVYRCNKGYKMTGSNALTCTENGWNQHQPVCNVVTCDAPNVPNAIIVGGKTSVYKYDESINYRCDEGYIINGSSIMKCTERGWTHSPPVCTKEQRWSDGVRTHFIVFIVLGVVVIFCLGSCIFYMMKSKKKTISLATTKTSEDLPMM